jgi:DNA topoisomerase-3
VQTPTLAMLVQRDNDIKNFIKEKYYTVEINCGEYTAFSEKFTDFGQADKLQKLCKIAKAKVVDISTEEKKINPPRLYDLTTLQRDANRIYGFTAQQTLDTVQRLYDNRLSTYPRTDSQYLTKDMEETARMVISAIMNKTQFAEHTQYTVKNANIQSVINNKKVSDHHAIIPTINIETTDFCNLTDMDRKILYLISARLLSATAEQHIYENTMVTLDCNGYKFTAKGKAVIRKGYKQILDNFFNCVRIKQDAEDKTLPNIQFDNEYNVTSKTVEHYTQPPKPFTEDTLLSVMERAGNEDYTTDDVERKGLGTPATRASIIETIISRGYAQRNKKQLVPTDMGKKLIECVPEKLKSAKLTAEWENRLTLIAKGESNSLDFMRDIVDFVNQFIDNNKNINVNVSLFSSKEVIGKCPRCGAEVYEGTSNFYCSEDGCSFVLWKKNKFFESKKKEITKAVAKSLLSTGRVHCKDLYSPTKDKNYEADIVLDDTGEYINFKLVF